MEFSRFDDFYLVEGKKYKLNNPIVWEVGKKNSGYKIYLPKNYTFDVSVPFFLEWLVSPHDRRLLLAAAVHDELTIQGYDIAFSSAEFRRASVARGYNRAGAWVLFLATFFFLTFREYFKPTCF